MGKSTINGLFSIAMLNYQRVHHKFWLYPNFPKSKGVQIYTPKSPSWIGTSSSRPMNLEFYVESRGCVTSGNLTWQWTKKQRMMFPLKKWQFIRDGKKRSIRDFTLHITFFLKHHFPTIFPYAFSPDMSGWLNPWFSYGIFATISPRDLPLDLTLRWLGTFLGRDGDQGQGGKGSHG